MGWKRNLLESLCAGLSRLAPAARSAPTEPESIFVLRNNNLGDVLVITPLFSALRARFPHARIIAGLGSWAVDVVKNHPCVDEVLPINAPWHNHQASGTSPFGALRYLMRSPEVRALRGRRCAIGIDVLGSGYGSLLLLRGRIPWRLGVRGYAGGHSAVQQAVEYDETLHVGRAALKFAELLGLKELPENRPQIFLEAEPERHGAIVLAPGGGYSGACWPAEHFIELARIAAPRRVIVVGAKQDEPLGAAMAAGNGHVVNQTGALTLRETFAVIAGASAVVCNSSMAMHAAAAFRRPCVVTLGPYFTDAPSHAAQWGYPETVVLGREPSHPELWAPREVRRKLAPVLTAW
jgi:heptosyltransferase-2